MAYKVKQELTPDRWRIIFECDPQGHAAMLRDFPDLRRVKRKIANGNGHASTEQRERAIKKILRAAPFGIACEELEALGY